MANSNSLGNFHDFYKYSVWVSVSYQHHANVNLISMPVTTTSLMTTHQTYSVLLNCKSSLKDCYFYFSDLSAVEYNILCLLDYTESFMHTDLMCKSDPKDEHHTVSMYTQDLFAALAFENDLHEEEEMPLSFRATIDRLLELGVSKQLIENRVDYYDSASALPPKLCITKTIQADLFC